MLEGNRMNVSELTYSNIQDECRIVQLSVSRSVQDGNCCDTHYKYIKGLGVTYFISAFALTGYF